ncbi:MAG: ATP-binding protein [Pseudohongiellaceae bacterium]|nr:ATP-binding protein [Pseudohongiellaceae bacterium]
MSLTDTSHRKQASAHSDAMNMSAWTDGPELTNPDALQMAFRAFTELSTDLSSAYETLQGRVEQLTEEVEQANTQRLREISEKERIASRLENLLQLLPGGVVVLNSLGQVTDCNAAAIELLGEPLQGQFWRDIILSRFSPRSDDGHEISLKNGKRVSLATRSLNDEPGQIILITDQTETRQLQQHLSRHQRLSAMGKMVSSLAHQIRTPLSAALLYAGQLSAEDSDINLEPEQTQKFAKKIVSRLHNMERQVADMLLFARGDAVLDESITTEELLEDLQVSAEVVLRGSFGCEWINDAPGVPLDVNREALIGALLNLIENALQAAGREAALLIGVQLVAIADEQEALELFVQDNGPGISAELIQQITEPFFTTRAQGTGLGLAVAQVVAKAHKGEFFIESEGEGCGTKAGFRLPLANNISNK